VINVLIGALSDAVYVVYHYIQRLAKQKLEKELRYSRSLPGYAPVPGKEESVPLTQPNVQYPYSDKTNAFGSTPAYAAGAAGKV